MPLPVSDKGDEEQPLTHLVCVVCGAAVPLTPPPAVSKEPRARGFPFQPQQTRAGREAQKERCLGNTRRGGW